MQMGLLLEGSRRPTITHLIAETEGKPNWIKTLDSDKGRWLSYERFADRWFKWTIVNLLRESGVPVDNVDVGDVAQRAKRSGGSFRVCCIYA